MPAAEDVLAQEALGLGLGDGAVEPLCREIVLAAHVDERPLRLDGMACQDDPLDQLVRVVFHDHSVFEGSRLRLIGVDDQIARVLARGEEAPLLPGREARAAAAADVGGLHLVDDLLGRFPAREDGFGYLVAAVGDVGVDLVRIGLVHAAQQEVGLRLAAVAEGAERPAFARVEPLARGDQRYRLFHFFGRVQLLEEADLARGLFGAHEHRRGGARPQALDLAQGELAVVRGLPEFDGEPFFQPLGQHTRPAQHARHVGAELDVVLPRRFMGLVHVIEAGELTDFGHVETKKHGYLSEDGRGQPADLALGDVQRRA